MKTQYITDDEGEKIAVVLPIKKWRKMLEELEELDDIKTYDKIKKSKLKFTEANEAFNEIEKTRESND